MENQKSFPGAVSQRINSYFSIDELDFFCRAISKTFKKCYSHFCALFLQDQTMENENFLNFCLLYTVYPCYQQCFLK